MNMKYKVFHDEVKFKHYPQIQFFRKYYKENSNPRELTIPTKTQAINNIIPAKSGETHTHSNMELILFGTIIQEHGACSEKWLVQPMTFQ